MLQRFLIFFTTESAQTQTKTKLSRYRSRFVLILLNFVLSGEI